LLRRSANAQAGMGGARMKNQTSRYRGARCRRTLVSVAPVAKRTTRGSFAGMGIEVSHLPSPPAHLSQSARDWWQITVDRYVLEEHHLRLLQLVCEAWDEAQKARAQLAQDGLTVPGREGGLRPHPCVAIERDARLAVARLVRELDLDTGPPVSERVGPAGLLSNRGGRNARKTASS
jgi:P27 family predicted phage terminase small subunit